ncbi:hypothetical protein [Kribbella sp. VKM Ac-2568]|uniref:hypothetical protein n=1 Tax=Kribbella sp. VKM Ac-2568 TaxID=2512219 RepID=UPI001049A844|nr:hypothetical protein [Kribbella sp. VKM Ac-2568]
MEYPKVDLVLVGTRLPVFGADKRILGQTTRSELFSHIDTHRADHRSGEVDVVARLAAQRDSPSGVTTTNEVHDLVLVTYQSKARLGRRARRDALLFAGVRGHNTIVWAA